MKTLLLLLVLSISNLVSANTSNNVFLTIQSYDSYQNTAVELDLPDSAIDRLTIEDENFISCIYQFKDDEFDTPIRAGLMIGAISDSDVSDKNLIFSLVVSSGKNNEQLEDNIIANGATTEKQSQINSIFQTQMIPNHNFSGQGYDSLILLSGQAQPGNTKTPSSTISIMSDKEWSEMNKYQGVKMNKWYCFFED